MESKDVFVVRDRNNGLQNEDARSSDDRVLGAKIGMFPQNPVVLLVAADHIWHLDWIAIGVVVPSVKILDGA